MEAKTWLRVRLDGTDNGRYMAVNSEQPLSVKMSHLDNSNDRHFMAVIGNGRE
jgi:hypothetical protein